MYTHSSYHFQKNSAKTLTKSLFTTSQQSWNKAVGNPSEPREFSLSQSKTASLIFVSSKGVSNHLDLDSSICGPSKPSIPGLTTPHLRIGSNKTRRFHLKYHLVYQPTSKADVQSFDEIFLSFSATIWNNLELLTPSFNHFTSTFCPQKFCSLNTTISNSVFNSIIFFPQIYIKRSNFL